MPKRVDITGRRYGRLVAVRRAGTVGKNAQWLCRCDCGETALVALHMLRQGFTRSCGCLRRESAVRNGRSPATRLAASKMMHARHAARRAEQTDAAQPCAWRDLIAAWPLTF